MPATRHLTGCTHAGSSSAHHCQWKAAPPHSLHSMHWCRMGTKKHETERDAGVPSWCQPPNRYRIMCRICCVVLAVSAAPRASGIQCGSRLPGHRCTSNAGLSPRGGRSRCVCRTDAAQTTNACRMHNASGHSRLLPASASCPLQTRCAPHSLQDNATTGSPPDQQPSLGHLQLSGPSQVLETGCRGGTCPPAEQPASPALPLGSSRPRRALGHPSANQHARPPSLNATCNAAVVTVHLTRCDPPPQPPPHTPPPPKCSPRACPPTPPRPLDTQFTTPPGQPSRHAPRAPSALCW